MGAIATTDVAGMRFIGVAVVHDLGAHAVFVLRKRFEPGIPFDSPTGGVELVDQEALMVILRVGECKWIRREPSPQVGEADCNHVATVLVPLPQVGGACLNALC